MMGDDQGMLNLINQGMEAVATLRKYKGDSEDKIRHLESLSNPRCLPFEEVEDAEHQSFCEYT
ncbi:hypothetical protein LOAG_13459 [Loa loa]|uniref:Uncharacterized protein n=1 Tax=Loa loa TaxID=7209 RepID=A0A1S0TJD2_LOALO|nr:hypothetical protein LOAG_13459 [Loa loa]EFO15056.1 hypothetical protein LOAG_13459 [Loa loa]